MKAFHKQHLDINYRGKKQELCEKKNTKKQAYSAALYSACFPDSSIAATTNVVSIFALSSKRMIKQQKHSKL